MRSWECLVRVVHVCARDRFFGNIVGNAKMAMKNTLVIYEEVYRCMILFIIYKSSCISDFSKIWKFVIASSEYATVQYKNQSITFL